tara:strand:+ start:1453 stop:2049 length:597 start_codon:yes stop_codon:yes gene_type:complete
MYQKVIIQILLILLICIALFFSYKFYFSEGTKKKLETVLINENQEKTDQIDRGNIIKNISYNSFNSLGDIYEITAEYGEINSKNANIIIMNNVNARITDKDKDKNKIKVSSNFAIYNTLTYETNFYDDVLVLYAETSIKSKNLDFFFEKNLVYMSNEIVYKNSNTELEADNLEINILSNDVRLYMNNKNEKIKIKGNY